MLSQKELSLIYSQVNTFFLLSPSLFFFWSVIVSLSVPFFLLLFLLLVVVILVWILFGIILLDGIFSFCWNIVRLYDDLVGPTQLVGPLVMSFHLV